MATLYTFNNKLVKINNKFIQKYVEPEPPTPPGPTFDEVTIGNQIWMSKNLAIDDGQGGIIVKTLSYPGIGDVVEYYYNGSATNRIVASIDGWHLPTIEEVETLFNQFSATQLKSVAGWMTGYNGTNESKFNLLPAGTGQRTSYDFSDGYIWTNSFSGSFRYMPGIWQNTKYLNTVNKDSSYYVPLRLLKDS